ncbi:MAG: hypothetical protein D6731_13915 [Planctomycetota bacterium]|nr:MAG: hypothetical protein D6731_13915 [Planctomycetota bacterium]
MRELCAVRGIPFVALLIPIQPAVDPSAAKLLAARAPDAVRQAGFDWNLSTRQATALLADLGVVALDPSDALRTARRAGPTHFDFDGHLTPRGCRAVAAALLAHRDVIFSASAATDAPGR